MEFIILFILYIVFALVLVLFDKIQKLEEELMLVNSAKRFYKEKVEMLEKKFASTNKECLDYLEDRYQ